MRFQQALLLQKLQVEQQERTIKLQSILEEVSEPVLETYERVQRQVDPMSLSFGRLQKSTQHEFGGRRHETSKRRDSLRASLSVFGRKSFSSHETPSHTSLTSGNLSTVGTPTTAPASTSTTTTAPEEKGGSTKQDPGFVKKEVTLRRIKDAAMSSSGFKMYRSLRFTQHPPGQ